MVICVVDSLEAYQAANSQKDEVVTKVNTIDLKWEAPNNNFVKVNWDFAVDINRMKIGIGMIVRDGMGELLATPSLPRDYITKPNIVEAY